MIIAHVIDSYRIVMCPYENNLRSIIDYIIGPREDDYIRTIFKQLVLFSTRIAIELVVLYQFLLQHASTLDVGKNSEPCWGWSCFC